MNITGCCNSDTSSKPQSLSPCPAAIEQFRPLGEINCHLSGLVHRQEAGVSCGVWVDSTMEHAELLPSGILNGESALDIDDPPRRRKAADHVFPSVRWLFDSRGIRVAHNLARLLRKQQPLSPF